jgi:glycosyl transferase, family 25
MFVSAPVSTLIKVISLASDAERRLAFGTRAASSRVAWSYFDAHTELSPHLRYAVDEAIVHRGRALTCGELGCYSSHYTLWQEFLASPYRQLLVLEDDTLVDWCFVERLVAFDLAATGIDYLRLFSKSLGKPALIGPMLDRYLIENVSYSFGTQAYMLTRTGAVFLTDALRDVVAPVDDSLDHGWRGALPSYAIFPPPVIEIAGSSRIGSERRERQPIPARLRQRRSWFRTIDRLRRTLYAIRRRIVRLKAIRQSSMHVQHRHGTIRVNTHL